jgi:hypothetical protein
MFYDQVYSISAAAAEDLKIGVESALREGTNGPIPGMFR